MLSAIFGRSPPQGFSSDRQVPLITFIMQQATAFCSVWNHAPCIKEIKRAIDFSRLPKEHPFFQETMKRFQFIRPGKALPSSSFNQENAKIREVIESIEKNGLQYSELNLNDVNDELLEAIKTCCKNLKTINIKQKDGYASLSDKGLIALAGLPQLKSVTIEGVFPQVSEEGLKKMLSSKTFVNQVSDLSLHLLQITDAVYAIICAYERLNFLSLHAYYLTPAIATFFPPASLKAFKLEQTPGFAPSPFSNMLISLLANIQLTTLGLKGEAQISEEVMSACLSKQKMLLALELDLQPLTPKILESIPSNIFSLYLTRLDSILDFKPLFSNQTKLIELRLGDAVHLTSEDLATLKAPIESLHLDAPNLRAIPQFTTVKKLSLINNRLIESESFKKLNDLPSLTSLSLINCPRFDSNGLESFYNSSLRHQLESIELDRTGVCDLMPLTEFGNLRSIALRKCYSVNATHLCNFLGSLTLQTTVKGLYLDSLALKKIHLMLLCEFGYLVVLYIGNPCYLTEAEREDALKLPNLLTNNAIVYMWEGGSRLSNYTEAFNLVKEGTNPK